MSGKKKELSKALKTFFGVGDAGFNWMFSMENYYFNYFLTNVARFSLPMVTMITTITSTADAILSWIYGAILNSIKPMRWGRYRSWLLVVPWVIPFLYTFQFLKIGEGMLAAVIIIVGNLSSHILWNFPYIANATMVSVASSTSADRVALSSSRTLWNNISKILYSYVGPFTVSLMGAALGEVNAYAGTAFIFSVIMAVLIYAHFRMFEGYEETAESERASAEEKKKDSSKTSIGDLVKSLFQNPPLLVYLCCELCRNTWNFVVMGMTVYYFTYIAQNVGLMSAYLLSANLLAIVGVFVTRRVSKKISSRNTYMTGVLIMGVGPILAYFLSGSMPLVIIFMAVGQFGFSCTGALSAAIYGDIIIYSEWKTGKNAAGWIMGLQNIPIKVGVVIRGLVVSACLAAGSFVTGMDPADASAELINGIRMGYMLLPALVGFAAFILFSLGFRLTQDKIEGYEKEIQSRKG